MLGVPVRCSLLGLLFGELYKLLEELLLVNLFVVVEAAIRLPLKIHRRRRNSKVSILSLNELY
jgi:hypothetical protein